MWTFQQSTGKVFSPTGSMLGVGYSGFGNAKNQSATQEQANGPMPQGHYLIAPAVVGMSMSLTPKSGVNTFSRAGFLLCAESAIKTPGTNSRSGNIVLDKRILQQIVLSTDRELEVVA